MKNRSVGYFRVSSKPQQEYGVSLDVQHEKYSHYVQRNGYESVRTFTDTYTGTRASRHGYQEMLDFLRTGAADVCIVVYLDRFGRDKRESITRKWELNDLGVRVEATDEFLGNPEDDDELYYLLGAWKAERESKRIGERSRSTKALKLRSGEGWWNGKPPYGWRHVRTLERGRIRSHLEIDETEAALVRQMAHWALAGESARRITIRLNQDGRRTRRGYEWRTTKVLEILQRPHNTGRLIWGRTSQSKSKHPIIVVDHAIPPLIDEETAQKLAEALARRRLIPGRALGAPNLLSGLLCCGYCGRRMRLKSKGKRTTRAFTCGSYQDSGTCRFNYQNATRLETAVIAALSPAADMQAALIALPSPTPARDLAGEIAAARRGLDLVEREVLTNHGLWRRGALSERQLALVNAELHERQAALEQRLLATQREQEQEQRRQITLSRLPVRVREFTEAITSLPIAAQKAQLQELVERITVWDDGRIEVRFRE